MKGLTTEDTEGTEGITLRDWFAGHALSGLLASGHFTLENDDKENDGAWMTTHPFPWDDDGAQSWAGRRKFDFPEAAWRCADEMLRARKGAK